jgi:hypothetical protein
MVQEPERRVGNGVSVLQVPRVAEEGFPLVRMWHRQCVASLGDQQRLSALCAGAQKLDDVAVTAGLQDGHLCVAAKGVGDPDTGRAERDGIQGCSDCSTRWTSVTRTSLSKSARCLSVASKGMT